MDFLKTLMLYMSLTFATSVQSTTAPQETPVPTYTPVPAVVEQVPGTAIQAPEAAPEATAYIAATAAPQVEAAATMTPNKAYKNLQLKSRGDSVKKLQERLIELGYLDAGDADGVFGRQTHNAVIAFQRANGLSADGVAGDATQTHLFENPNVVAKPAPAETPAPATPAPATPAPASTLELPEAEATEAPTAEPTAEPTPDSDALMRLKDAAIVLGDSGEKLTCLRVEDGVTVRVNPRIWRNAEGVLYIDMTDLATGAEGWTFALGMDGSYHLIAEGYNVVIAADGLSCQVDGETVVLAEGDFRVESDAPLCAPALLENALGAETFWDADEQTLMIAITPKALTEATD